MRYIYWFETQKVYRIKQNLDVAAFAPLHIELHCSSTSEVFSVDLLYLMNFYIAVGTLVRARTMIMCLL